MSIENLVAFLKENLEPKVFTFGEYNRHLSCYENGDSQVLTYFSEEDVQDIGTVYFDERLNEEIVAILNEEKVTVDELIVAFKELGWL